MSWKVKFYQTPRGKYPVQEFINELEKPTQTKIDGYLNLLADYGPFLKPPYAKNCKASFMSSEFLGKSR